MAAEQAKKPWTIVESRVVDPPLMLAVCEGAFRPNPTTVRFARAMHVEPGNTVFDIGTGIGPLAIKAAIDGAARVVAVDPVGTHCDLARANVERYGLNDRVKVYQGRFFEPMEREEELRGLRADVIIGDVSGIADAVARALGWYSSEVPTGGPDGTEVLLELLEQAPRYLKKDGRLYFPVAVDLADGQKVEAAARRFFGRVENALPRPYVVFPLSPEEVQTIHDAYPGGVPDFIQVQQGPRPSWRGQIWMAAEPK